MGHHTDSILAVTFTTKAAKELRERAALYIGEAADNIMTGTFHSICLRLLRMFAHHTGVYTNRFNVLDPDDCEDILEDILKRITGYSDSNKLSAFKNQISLLKNRLITPDQFDGYADANLETDYTSHLNTIMLADVYREYTDLLRRQNSMDFDDLILNMISVLNVQDVRNYCHNRFKFCMIDESQDTNAAQFKLIEELAGANNIFMVGDCDQSIFQWRGAKFENMFRFLEKYPDSEIIKLLQNYRSTTTIVEASNIVIMNNRNRFEKTCFTLNKKGEKIHTYSASGAYEEAQFVADEIQRLVSAGYEYKDIAVLFRINALGSEFEKELVSRRIPVSVIRGTGFYKRTEIKDITAILKATHNLDDPASMTRYLNVMPNIGSVTVQQLTELADRHNVSLINAANLYLGRNKNALQHAVNIIAKLSKHTYLRADKFVSLAVRETGYLAKYQSLNSGANAERIDNIKQFISNAAEYSKENPNETITGLLDCVALLTGDDKTDNGNTVKLQTVHSSKGLEYKAVFVTGLEENTFPYYNRDRLNAEVHLEEERRLFYVAVTRAQERLYLTCARKRLISGVSRNLKESQFIKEIPGALLQSI